MWNATAVMALQEVCICDFINLRYFCVQPFSAVFSQASSILHFLAITLLAHFQLVGVIQLH